MNSKKNKKKSQSNKPPNRHPPQKAEDEAVETSDVVQVEEKPEVVEKVEERVPEISSGVVSPVVDSEAKDEDSPKKPKRNRGKNKNQESIEKDSTEKAQIKDVTVTETAQTAEEAVPNVPDVAASARKKKNKNKKHAEPEVNTPEPTAHIVSLPTEVAQSEEPEKIVSDIIEASSATLGDWSTEHEGKSKKKNKKKKNRNDSEKSEKADELSCVSAFQKLLTDEKSDPSDDVNFVLIGDTKSETKESSSHEEKKCSEPEQNLEELIKVVSNKPTSENSGKNKKKNKKDKTQLPLALEELCVDNPIVLQESIESKAMTESAPKVDDEKKIKKSEELMLENTAVDIAMSEETKKSSKAKIAKPVERKIKDRVEDSKEFSTDSTAQCGASSPLLVAPETISHVSKSETEKTLESNIMPPMEEQKKEIKQEKHKDKKGKKDIQHIDKSDTDKKLKKDIPHIDKSETDKNLEKNIQHVETSAVAKKAEKDNQETDASLLDKKAEKKGQHTSVIAKKPEIGIQQTDFAAMEKTSEKDIQHIESSAVVEKTEKDIQQIDISVKDKKGRKDIKHIDSAAVDQKTEKYIQNVDTLTMDKEAEKDIQPTDTIVIERKEEKDVQHIDTKMVEAVANILPPENTMGKKRKKSPKPKSPGLKEESKQDFEVLKSVESDKPVNLATLLATEIKTDPLPEVKSIKISHTDESKPVSIETDVKYELAEGSHKNKSKKKGKKIPDIPLETQTQTKGDEPIIPHTLSSEAEKKEDIAVVEKKKIKDENKIATEKSSEFVIVMPFKDDKSTSSMKLGAQEESSCSFTPDIIQHPRASSENLIDDNNNRTIIQEISTMDDAKLQTPIALPYMPIIQGSGETPMVTPDATVIKNLATASIRITPKTNVDEKTDIKSKMMEVNQDMEELRLSIERSLAELTAIEKSEEKLDTKFTDTVLHITEEPLTLGNISNPSVTPVKSTSEPENITVVLPHKEHTSLKETESKKYDPKSEKCDLTEQDATTEMKSDTTTDSYAPTAAPRKDHRNKGKSKKKGKHEQAHGESSSTSTTTESKPQEKDTSKDESTETKPGSTKEKVKQQSDTTDSKGKPHDQESSQTPDYENLGPIENFEDAMTSSADDINRTFEIIANEANEPMEASHVNPEINITAPIEDTKIKDEKKKDEKINPVSQPKNLLGHTDIPVPSNRIDYKKEKNKTPNESLAKVKIKDGIQVESKRQSKESQTDNIRKFMKKKTNDESLSLMTNESEDFLYKYSFRKVFLQSACHVCKKDVTLSRVPCGYCNLVFYCSNKHKDEDWPLHQGLCFAVSTIVHLKGEKHIYASSKDVIGHNYRLLRMQMIVSCEKIVKRRLVPWEQEALLYPRMCAEPGCREWKQSKLLDCDGCGQISYCAEHPEHLPKSHQRWCKSYSLYQKLVCFQQTKGKLEPKMPSKVMLDYKIPENINEVLASMYEEKIDMNDIQYAALTQIATAPLTAAYCYQTYNAAANPINGLRKQCIIHVLGAELQFEAAALDKWEVFFLHLTAARELLVVLVAADLNPYNLPLELLSKVKSCQLCRQKNRTVVFHFQDKKAYHEYYGSEDFLAPNLVCAFNASIDRSSLYSNKDPWPKTINCILKQKVPFILTSYSLSELQRDLIRVKDCAEYQYKTLIEAKNNSFASVRPDRNFISDDEMPLLFKNYSLSMLCGVC